MIYSLQDENNYPTYNGNEDKSKMQTCQDNKDKDVWKEANKEQIIDDIEQTAFESTDSPLQKIKQCFIWLKDNATNPNNKIFQVGYRKYHKAHTPCPKPMCIFVNTSNIKGDTEFEKKLFENTTFASTFLEFVIYKKRNAILSAKYADHIKENLLKSRYSQVNSAFSNIISKGQGNNSNPLSVFEHFHLYNVNVISDGLIIDVYEISKPLNDCLTEYGNSIFSKCHGLTSQILNNINVSVFDFIFEIRTSLYLKNTKEEHLNMSFDDFVNNISVCLVRSKDKYYGTGIHDVIVKNIFSGELELREIPNDSGIRKDCEYEYGKNDTDPIFDYLGCYCPDKGCIFIWVDKIYDECGQNESNYNFENLFTTVLVHEYIHALFDVKPRKSTYYKNVNTKCLYEEGLDNALVLHALRKTGCFTDAQKFISLGQRNLPSYYHGYEMFRDYSLDQITAIIREWLPNK